MDRRLIGIPIVLLLILPSIITAHAITPVQTTEQSLLREETVLPEELTEEQVLELLESVSLGTIFTNIEQYLDTKHTLPLFRSSLNQGIRDLETQGIRRSHTLRDLFTSSLFKLERTKNRCFLVSILPRRTVVSTIIQPTVINLTAVNTSFGEFPLQLELFVKIVPLIDRISTTQYGTIRPQLTQKTLWWPAVGARITFAEWFTLGIVAFGPRIKWTRSIE